MYIFTCIMYSSLMMSNAIIYLFNRKLGFQDEKKFPPENLNEDKLKVTKEACDVAQ